MLIGSEENLEKSLTLLDRVPRWPRSHQWLSLEVYRQLARGEPVPIERVAESLRIPVEEVSGMLKEDNLRGLVMYDEADRIIGLRGLAVFPTHHRLEVEGRTLFTWCAMDTLFTAEVLAGSIGVESPCPRTGTLVRLTLTPDGVEKVEPADVVVSFLCNDAGVLETSAAKLIASFCHHIFFLASPEAGVAWTAAHPGTFLLTLDQAYEWGRRFNAVQLGDALTSGAATA
jgi:alkylmercury lyase